MPKDKGLNKQYKRITIIVTPEIHKKLYRLQAQQQMERCEPVSLSDIVRGLIEKAIEEQP